MYIALRSEVFLVEARFPRAREADENDNLRLDLVEVAEAAREERRRGWRVEWSCGEGTLSSGRR
jgi:hypothetical protein